MELADLFETTTEKKTKKKAKSEVKHRINNPEDLSPEALKHFSRITTGVAQRVNICYRNGSYVYLSHSCFE